MNDIITINLNIFERQFLVFLSERGGRADMKSNILSNHVLDALDALQKKGAISKTRLIGNEETYQYNLTSIGTNLVDLIKENPNA
jgi:DNA-binding HxlR family transcriptional regulator